MKIINRTPSAYLIYLLFISAAMISCGGGGGGERETPPAPVVNTPPTAPTLISPTDKVLCISNAVNLSWNASSDSQNDAITYQVQVATDNQFIQVVATGNVTAPSYSVTLDKGKAYYWRVKATDSKSASSDYSPVYSFYTEGTATSNHAPYMPQLVTPSMDATVTPSTVNLEWNASDVDASDVLTYDLYWGTDRTNLQNSKLNHSTKTHQLTTLAANTTYYWKVVVKDGKGGETIGQIWSFKTN
jgi:hypothetical protein